MAVGEKKNLLFGFRGKPQSGLSWNVGRADVEQRLSDLPIQAQKFPIKGMQTVDLSPDGSCNMNGIFGFESGIIPHQLPSILSQPPIQVYNVNEGMLEEGMNKLFLFLLQARPSPHADYFSKRECRNYDFDFSTFGCSQNPITSL